jgi:predicted amidohydrolase YtcJ
VTNHTDFVVAPLDQMFMNPWNVDPTTIRDIKVVETIKEGKTIYKAQ